MDRTRRTNKEPAVSERLEVIEVFSRTPNMALVRARLALRDTRRGRRVTVERPFLRSDRAGAWRGNLREFVGLAPYFPPEHLPTNRPSFGPRGGQR